MLSHVTARRGARGWAGLVVALALALACAAALVPFGRVALAAEPAAASATADARATGSLTVSGVPGVEEGAGFATLEELALALDGQEGVMATVTVHGTVAVAGPVDLAGASLRLVGADASSRLAFDAAGQGGLSVLDGTLEASGLTFDGHASLSAAAGLSLRGCSFTAPLSCESEGDVTVTGCSFVAVGEGAALACDVVLSGEASTLSFTDNTVRNYAAGLQVSRAEGLLSAGVSATGNSFVLNASGQDVNAAAVRLAGAGWASTDASLAGNTAEPAHVDTVTVSYDANGATAGTAPAAVTVSAGGKATVDASSSLVKAGCEFLGWNTAADGSGTSYAAGQVFAPTQSVTLYAQWSAVGTVATVDVTAHAAGTNASMTTAPAAPATSAAPAA